MPRNSDLVDLGLEPNPWDLKTLQVILILFRPENMWEEQKILHLGNVVIAVNVSWAWLVGWLIVHFGVNIFSPF